MPAMSSGRHVSPYHHVGGWQRNSEARRALFIQLHSVLLDWNLLQAEKVPQEQRPNVQLWQAVLVSTMHVVERSYCNDAAGIAHAQSHQVASMPSMT